MNDTPRTDAKRFEFYESLFTPAEFAQTLEREVDAMAKQCLKLVEEIKDMNAQLRQSSRAKDHAVAKEKKDTARLDALFKSGGFSFDVGPDYTEQVTTRAQIDELIMMNHE